MVILILKIELTSVSHLDAFRFFSSGVKIFARRESRSPSASTDPTGNEVRFGFEDVWLEWVEDGPKKASRVFSTCSSSELNKFIL